MVKALPNIITGLSLLSGSLSLVFLFQGEMRITGFLILLAALFDFLDGFVARMLNTLSEIGKIVDSLSDLVCFGVAPAMVFYVFINDSLSSLHSGIVGDHLILKVIPYLPVLLILASAFRLARFSTGNRKHTSFEGMPTTAAGIFIASMAIISTEITNDLWENIFSNIYFLVSGVLLISLLEVIKIPIINFKFETYQFKKNIEKYFIAVVSIVLLVLYRWEAIPLIIIIYLGISILLYIGGLLVKKTY